METKPYLVSWRVEVDATSAEAAAEIAQISMQDMTREVNIFVVSEPERLAGENNETVVRVGVHDGRVRG